MGTSEFPSHTNIVSSAGSDMPWKAMDKHELGKMLTEMQALKGQILELDEREIASEIEDLQRVISEKIENMSVCQVLTTNSFAIDLKVFKPPVTGMSMNRIP